MRLSGSCHCAAVRFSLSSAHPVPYQRCYCSICRKTSGGGGYAINIAGDARSLKVDGQENITTFHAVMREDGQPAHLSNAERTFCRLCGSALWLFSADWPELIHPLASVIDTPLPEPPAVTHIMLAFKPDWVRLETKPGDEFYDGYPDESIAEWHQRHGMEQAGS